MNINKTMATYYKTTAHRLDTLQKKNRLLNNGFKNVSTFNDGF